MKYDATIPRYVNAARTKFEKLIAKGAVFELTECRKRSLRQNDYLSVTIRWWGMQTGYTESESRGIYKQVNKDLYFRKKTIAGIDTFYVRHTNELTKEEMSLSIERWRNWAAANEVKPVYIPSPDDHRLVELMEMEVERNKMYL